MTKQKEKVNILDLVIILLSPFPMIISWKTSEYIKDFWVLYFVFEFSESRLFFVKDCIKIANIVDLLMYMINVIGVYLYARFFIIYIYSSILGFSNNIFNF